MNGTISRYSGKLGREFTLETVRKGFCGRLVLMSYFSLSGALSHNWQMFLFILILELAQGANRISTMQNGFFGLFVQPLPHDNKRTCDFTSSTGLSYYKQMSQGLKIIAGETSFGKGSVERERSDGKTVVWWQQCEKCPYDE